jgi:DNA polymerase-3 subunit delta
VVDAVFAGRAGEADAEFGKARASGSSPAAIISAAIRQVANLHKMKLALEGGDPIESVMKRAGPPVHFSRERAVGEALRAWPPARLLRAMEQLAEATLEMRRNAPLAEAIAQRTLLSIAVNARKKA